MGKRNEDGGSSPGESDETDEIANHETLFGDMPTRPGGDGQGDGHGDSQSNANVRHDTDPGLPAVDHPGLDPALDTGVDTGVDEIPGAVPAEIAGDATPPDGVPTPVEQGEGGDVIDFADAQAQANLELGAEAAASDDEEDPGKVPFEQLEPLIEALIFASDRPVTVPDLKRLTGESDSRLVSQALTALIERRAGTGVQVAQSGGAYSFRTNPMFADWVSKLVAGKPVRLSRAMLETLAIVAYRQPITRPEIDDIRGVDCGPVLKTLLDRNLVRIIGKKEEVGRPMLYGTTPEFLRIFSLKDLTQLPTLRQFHELSIEHQAKVDENHPAAAIEAAVGVIGAPPLEPLSPPAASGDPDEDDRLIADLEEASEAANRAAAPLSPTAANPESSGS